jgi:stage III sporulation protein AB
MLRAVAALAILCCAVAVGYHLTARLSERVRILGEFRILLDTAASRMRCTRGELSAIFSDNFADYAFSRERPFKEQWPQMVARFHTVLNKKDCQVLADFSNGMGAGDLESQLRHIDLYQELLNERLEDAKKDREDKAGLYRVLPFSLGLTLAILLL